MSTEYTPSDKPSGPPVIEGFEIDEFNEAEMARHGVSVAEIYQVLLSGSFRVGRNKAAHSSAQPFILRGFTDGGRLLFIPIQPDEDRRHLATGHGL